MATKKRGHRRAAVKRVAKSAYRRTRRALDTRPGKILMASAIATGGAVGTSFAINNIPKVKDLSAGMKSGIQIALGFAGIFLVRNKMVKAASAGSVIAGVMGGVKALTGINPMAGPSAGIPTLSQSQMQRLMQTGGMSLPVSRVRMNQPAMVRMRGPFNGGSPSKGLGGLDT